MKKEKKKNQLTLRNWLDFALSLITAIDNEIKNEGEGRVMVLICEWAFNIALQIYKWGFCIVHTSGCTDSIYLLDLMEVISMAIISNFERRWHLEEEILQRLDIGQVALDFG